MIWPLVSNSPLGTSWLPIVGRPDSSTSTSRSLTVPLIAVRLIVSVAVDMSPSPSRIAYVNTSVVSAEIALALAT